MAGATASWDLIDQPVEWKSDFISLGSAYLFSKAFASGASIALPC
jgi:hypothetical protein